ncbi:MAG: HAD-IA family hydrolase, partial [Bacteroidales bacterium]|nr:HAD-IA family hydrolase [Bacteroidales bacterium]
EIYEKIVKNKIQTLPGAKEFIERCRQKSLKLALVTSADEVKMLINLKEIGIPTSKFDVLINGLDVERKKPFPDIYLKAAGELEIKPENCLVVEDAVSGVKAAKSAGMRCLALLTSFNEKDLKGSDWIVQNLKSAPEEAINW